MAYRDLQAGFGGERGQLGLPCPCPVAVGAAGVRGDQQPPRTGVAGPALPVPPAAQRLHGERGGVVVGADVDPAGAGSQVVDPVWDRLAQLGVGEVVGLDRLGLAFRAPLPAAVGVGPISSFFLVSTLTTGSLSS